jgi:hypothetical protein
MPQSQNRLSGAAQKKIGQPQYQLWEKSRRDKGKEKRPEEWPLFAYDTLETLIGNLRCQVGEKADRGRNEANHEIQDNDHAKVNGINARLLDEGHKHRHDYHETRVGIEDASPEKKEKIQDAQDHRQTCRAGPGASSNLALVIKMGSVAGEKLFSTILEGKRFQSILVVEFSPTKMLLSCGDGCC